MNELKNLLQSSIKEFEDKNKNCTAIPCVYLPAANGMAYLVKETCKQILISASIHLSTEQEQREDGVYNTGFVSVSTQNDVFAQFEEEPDTIIIDYNGFILGINKSGEFNNVAQTWHYTGEILLNRNEQYIILDEEDAATLILSDSTTKWLDIADELGVVVYPSYISVANKKDVYMTIMIQSSKALAPVRQISDTAMQQYKQDVVKISLINATLQQAQDLAKDIFEAPEKYGTFGIQDYIGWETINEYTQKSFGLKQNIRTATVTVNYQLDTTTTNSIKYFKQIAATINGNKFETPLLP